MTTDDRQPTDPTRRRLIRFLAVLGAATGVTGLAGLLSARRDPSPATTTTLAATATTTTTRAASTTTSQAETTTTIPAAVLRVITKKAWAARPSGQFTRHSPVQLTIHHTDVGGATYDSAADRIRGYQDFHLSQGWPDVAYHFLIDPDGRVYEGRPPQAVGDTFTEYDPTGHFLVCLDGDFDVDYPTEQAIDSLVLVLLWAVQEFGIDPTTVAGHRDFADLSCPGEHLYGLLWWVEQRLVDLVEAGYVVEALELDDPV